MGAAPVVIAYPRRAGRQVSHRGADAGQGRAEAQGWATVSVKLALPERLPTSYTRTQYVPGPASAETIVPTVAAAFEARIVHAPSAVGVPKPRPTATAGLMLSRVVSTSPSTVRTTAASVEARASTVPVKVSVVRAALSHAAERPPRTTRAAATVRL